MNSENKQLIANFLDIAGDFIGSGYKSEKKEYKFEDNSLQEEEKKSGNKYIDKEDITPVNAEIDTIEQVANEIRICKKCSLGSTRTNAAPGEGSLIPIVMVIGEGPGEDEDKQGRPFVGKAGQLLDKMLNSIGLARTTNTFIANVVKCRPQNNRDPYPEETAACARFLERQITILKPRFILVAGRVAAQTLLKTTEPIGKLRGRFTELTVGTSVYPLLVTYHPAALLRNEDYKRPAWEDLKLLKSKIDNAG